MIHEVEQLEHGKISERQVASYHERLLVPEVISKHLAHYINLLDKVLRIALLEMNTDTIIELVMDSRHHICASYLFSVTTKEVSIILFGDIFHDRF